MPKQKSREDFWREYEEKTGEKVLARCMGRYVSGWDEFGDMTRDPLWGLIIATSGGFRFHHFPQTNWLASVFRSGDDLPKEKNIFIPHDKIICAELVKETNRFKKIFFSNVPRLLVSYSDETGIEKQLVLFAEYKPDGIAEALGQGTMNNEQ